MKAKSGPDSKKMLKSNEMPSGFSGRHPAPQDGHRNTGKKPKGGSGRN
jgi:hypothetical protein